MKTGKAVRGRVVDSPISNAKTTFRELKSIGKGVASEAKSQVMKGHPSGYTSSVRLGGVVKRPTLAKVPLRVGGDLVDAALGAAQRARAANRRFIKQVGR